MKRRSRVETEESNKGNEQHKNHGERLTTKSSGFVATSPLKTSSALTQSP